MILFEKNRGINRRETHIYDGAGVVWISAATSPGNGAGVTREFFGISNTLLTGTLFLRKAAETKGLFNDWVLEMCLKKLPEIKEIKQKRGEFKWQRTGHAGAEQDRVQVVSLKPWQGKYRTVRKQP